MALQVFPLSMDSNTLVELSLVARTRWFSSSNCTVRILASRSDKTRFHESPASVLRKSPPRAPSQMSPVLSTATELIPNSGSRGLEGNQLSPPLTETTTIFCPATATTLPATLMLPGTPIPGKDSCCQLAPAFAVTKRPDAVAAIHFS